MSYPVKEIWRNFLSVVAGVFITFFIIFPIVIFVPFISFSDSRISRSQEIFTDVLLISGALFGCIMGGYTTAKISTRKDIVHGIITGLVLTFLLVCVNEFEFDLRYPDAGIIYFGTIPVVLIGVYIAIRKKKSATKL